MMVHLGGTTMLSSLCRTSGACHVYVSRSSLNISRIPAMKSILSVVSSPFHKPRLILPVLPLCLPELEVVMLVSDLCNLQR